MQYGRNYFEVARAFLRPGRRSQVRAWRAIEAFFQTGPEARRAMGLGKLARLANSDARCFDTSNIFATSSTPTRSGRLSFPTRRSKSSRPSISYATIVAGGILIPTALRAERSRSSPVLDARPTESASTQKRMDMALGS